MVSFMSIDRRQFVASGIATALMPSLQTTGSNELQEQPEAESLLITDEVNWADFLRQHDLLWNKIPTKWGDTPFLGNGRLAVSVLCDSLDRHVLRFTLDNADVYDRRDDSWGWTAYSQSRYHVGDLLLNTVGAITGIQMRLVLHDGELTGTLSTTAGTIEFLAFVHPQLMVMAIRLRPSEGEKGYRWGWRAGEAVSSRPPVRNPQDQTAYQQRYGTAVKVWVDNPAPEITSHQGVHQCTQRLLAGGAYATGWFEVAGSGGDRLLYASCSMSWPSTDSIQDTLSEVRKASITGFDSLRKSNQDWWHAYYPASFLSVPDAQFESFYWIQMYKYGCASPKQTGIIDTHGPWLQPTNWPYITWNLNTQITYWALQPSNRLALANGLFSALDKYLPRLQQNAESSQPRSRVAFLGHCSQQDLRAPLMADVRFEKEWGNLLWICHNYWLQYRFTMDRALLQERLFPLLCLAVGFYLPHLNEGTDNQLHLPPTFSPEIGVAADCCYDLALLRWACETLTAACDVLQTHDSRMPRWREVATRLARFPTDEHGLRIGSDLAVSPHRHFSHLLMIYPLHLMNWDDESAKPLIKKSVDYWYEGARRGNADSGFTLAVGSSFYSTMRDGNNAFACLNDLLNSPTGMGKLMSNTMYVESGQNIETPLAAAQAFHDILLQSWGGRLRIFPAVPDSWRNLVFHNLRAEGSFLVSARMENGAVAWVRVKSLHGEHCILHCRFEGTPLAFAQSEPIELRSIGDDLYELMLRRGQEAIVSTTPSRPAAIVSPLSLKSANYYGLQHRRLPG